MATFDPIWLLPGSLLAIGLLTVGIAALRTASRRRSTKRPDWDRMMADTEYFRKAMRWVFKQQGFQVLGAMPLPVPYIEGPREILFHLRKQNKIYAALCGRWVVPVSADQVLHFQERLTNAFRVDEAMIITTSKFTPGAYSQAAGTPLKLCDGSELRQWVGG